MLKLEYFFDPSNLPENYFEELKPKNKNKRYLYNYPVGIVCYHNFFSPEELTKMEENIE